MGSIYTGILVGLVGGAIIVVTFLEPAMEGFQRVAEVLQALP